MATSSFAFSFMGLLVKIATGTGFEFPSFQLVLIRSVVQVFVSSVWLTCVTRVNPFGPDDRTVYFILPTRVTLLFAQTIAILII